MYVTVLKIDGMACGMCEAHINDAIRRNFSIKKVETSYKKRASEIISDNALDEKALEKVVTDAGYTLVSAACGDYVKSKSPVWESLSKLIQHKSI